MPSRFLFLALSLAIYSAKAQFVVQSGTVLKTFGTPEIVINSAGNVVLGDDNFDLSNAKLIVDLNGSKLSAAPGIMVHTHTTRFQFDELRMSGVDYELRGTWQVSKALTLTSGKLTVKNTASPVGRLIYTGNADAITASSSSYIIGPMFTAGNSQTRLYPIGNVFGFYPAQLDLVKDVTALLRMECISTTASTPPISLDQLKTQFPENIDTLITDRYYNFKVFNPGSFSGVPIALSLNDIIIDQTKHIPVVVELDTASSTIKNLEGSPQSDFILSAGRTTSYGGKYMIAASKDVAVKIHKLITPNGDTINDELYIEGIDLYPNNKVTLLDRWGGEYLTVQNFKNNQGVIDYSKLVNGNYICVVEYTDSKGKHKPKPQMITVLK